MAVALLMMALVLATLRAPTARALIAGEHDRRRAEGTDNQSGDYRHRQDPPT
jgi:hypothetical protein